MNQAEKDQLFWIRSLLRKFRDQYEKQRRPLSLDGHWKLSDAIKETLKEIKEVLGEKDATQEEDMVTVVETPMQVYESDLSGIKTVTLTAKPLSFLCKPSWVLQDELTEAMRDSLCEVIGKEMDWQLTATPEQKEIRDLKMDVSRLEREILSLKRKIEYHEEVQNIHEEYLKNAHQEAESVRSRCEDLWNDSEYAREFEAAQEDYDEGLDDAPEDQS